MVFFLDAVAFFFMASNGFIGFSCKIPSFKLYLNLLNNTTGKYDPPLAKPTDGADYKWDESLYNSDNSQGWIKIADT